MKKHEDCADGCYLRERKGFPECSHDADEMCAWAEINYWRNMSWQERQGWMRARDEEVD